MDADVIVVGAGPTGLMLAAELRLAGVTVIVVDRQTEPMQQSRALGFSARTIEEFDQRGLLPRFGDLQTIPVGHFGGLPLDYRVLPGGSYGARGVPQSVTEGILAGRAVELGADVRRGHEVVGLVDDGSGVQVDVLTPGGVSRLRARYAVGCDGARSVVRRQAGIDFPGTEPTLEMWLADVTGPRLRPRFSGERVPGGMVMVLPMGPEVNRVVVYERATGLRHSSQPPTFRQVADAWQRLTGEDIHGARPLWVSWFTDSSRQAAEYRRGRVFLAGDAAHVHLPIGGQGMSAGVQDAVNLGWKLAAAVHGHAGPDLLDTYHSERHPVGARVLANTLAQRTLYLGGEQMQPLRDLLAELLGHDEVRRHLVGMVTGLDIRYDVGPGEHPLLGRRLPHQELVGEFPTGPKSTTVELLHAGHGVLLDLAGDAAVRAAAAGWADRVDTVTAGAHDAGSGTPLDGVAALLARPDGYVAWVGTGGTAPDRTGPDGLAAALTRWFGPPR
jgi:bifunctional hydroxylase/dehydrase